MTARIFACKVCGQIMRLPANPAPVEVRLLDARMGWHAVNAHGYPEVDF